MCHLSKVDLTKTDGSTPIWDARTFADVSTSFVKVVVDTVYAAGQIGFKEVEFYHDNCLRGLFLVFKLISVVLTLFN